MCDRHATDGLLRLSADEHLIIESRRSSMDTRFVPQRDIFDFLLHVNAAVYRRSVKKSIDFDDPSMSCKTYKTLTGLTKDQFNVLLADTDLRSNVRWSKRSSLGVYLTRVRTG